MRSPLVSALEDFRNILGVCPHCRKVFRLTDIQISYRAKPRRTWLDELKAEDKRLQRAEERFDEREEDLRGLAQERGRRQLPRLLRKADPIFSPRGYFPQDVKPLFDPIDFVIFDGMNRRDLVRRVVLFDGPPDNRVREKIQRSVKRAICAGNFDWRTVQMSKEETIKG